MIKKTGFTPLKIRHRRCLSVASGKLSLTGFTLLEILVGIIIIGILTTLAVTHYGSAKEKILNKEAISNLKLIRAAQRSYNVEVNIYYPVSGNVSDIALINQYLRLMLSVGSSRYWNYMVCNSGCSRATRYGGDGRSWYLPIADEEPTEGAGCP